jgi:hypothetical protein
MNEQQRLASPYFRFGLSSTGVCTLAKEAIPKNVRLIGNGQVGGKARGLIFVMDHIAKGGSLTRYDDLLCFPDSLIVTTDVFDEFMEENNLQESVLAGCRKEITLDELRERIVAAVFPAAVRDQLSRFLEQEHRPLVVRSSSVMEDDPNHSFAGIYLSEFLANTGALPERLDALIAAIKRVYASTFGPNARAYRKRHQLPWQQEKMAILIQNMIGHHYPHNLFYPLIGGVAFSLNFYPWSDRMIPEDGVVRLVVGVGTRAVGREYARVFSPVAPGLRPEGSDVNTIIHYSQETVDVLDMRLGALTSTRLSELNNPLLRTICSVVDPEGTLSEPVSTLLPGRRYIASFNRFIEKNTTMPFTPLVRDLLLSLQGLFDLPIDFEFAVDFPSSKDGDKSPLLYLLQARPLGGRPEHRRIHIPNSSPKETLLVCHQVLGNGEQKRIRHLIFVNPHTYRTEDAYRIARRVGQIDQEMGDETYILMGPGRWGSSNPQWGVPVQYNEIAGATVIVEMATESFAPELSYGTHFYADMVASDLLYLPFREEQGDRFNRELLNCQQVLFVDPYVTHFRIDEGLDVYVDGEGKRGVIVCHT